MRNPNIDTTTPEQEEGVSNPRRDRELERPQGPGETGPELIPPGRVRTGQRGEDPDAGNAGKGDDNDDEAPADDDDISDNETGPHVQPSEQPTRGNQPNERGNQPSERGNTDAERGTRTPTRGGDDAERNPNRTPRQ